MCYSFPAQSPSSNIGSFLCLGTKAIHQSERLQHPASSSELQRIQACKSSDFVEARAQAMNESSLRSRGEIGGDLIDTTTETDNVRSSHIRSEGSVRDSEPQAFPAIQNLTKSCSRMNSVRPRNTHLFSTAAVYPAQPIADAFRFLQVVAELCVVLVNIQTEKPGVYWGVGVQFLWLIMIENENCLKPKRGRRTSTLSLLGRRSWSESHGGSAKGSRNCESSTASRALSFAVAEEPGGSPLPKLLIVRD